MLFFRIYREQMRAYTTSLLEAEELLPIPTRIKQITDLRFEFSLEFNQSEQNIYICIISRYSQSDLVFKIV